MDRADVDEPDRPAHWHRRDKRTSRRLAVKGLGLMVALQPAAAQQTAILARLVNVSGGGCCLTAAAWAVASLTPGLHCTVDLPATTEGVRQPATLLSMEPALDAPEDLLLRLRFRKADPLAQQQVTHWIGELAIQTWHSQEAGGRRQEAERA